jgi:hypothetical protein
MSIGIGDIIDDAMTTTKLDSVYIVWSEQESDIMFKRNVISFDPTINLSNTTGRSSSPAVSASGNNVYVVWDDDTSGNYEILYRKSADGGASFGGTVNLSNTSGYSASPAVSASGSQNVYVVWMDHSLGNFDILFRGSTDDGASFGGTVNLTNTSERSDEPAVAAFGDMFTGQSVCVVWNEDIPGTRNSEILYRRSTDGGASFGGTVNLSNTTGRSYAAAVVTPMVNVPQQDMYVVWTDEGSGILYRKSTDGGASFGRNMLLDPYYPTYAAVALSGNNVYVVYDANSEILYKKSTNGGDSFGGTVNISNTTENSYSPRVAAYNNLSF